ncbi:MAG: DUF3108 domain-containing protein [Gammaproteobacteria bacterium]|nr:DUF3108 domain-containing protein [Gammaproteobacteria bacterium]NNJ95218.1 DUF3108 domain-containing protein [Halobacteria archaeon]
MLKRLLIIISCTASGLSGSPGLCAALPDFTATYEVSRGALTIGTARLALTREPGGGYHYESHSWPARLAGLFNKDRLHETSSGQFSDSGLRPDKYHYLRTGGNMERVAHLTFDWAANVVVNNVAGSRWKMSVPNGTQDKLSTRLGMMQALARGETDFTFDVADGGTLKQYRYKVLGRETLELPAGTFSAVKVTELRGDERRKTWVWCAPALNYLPVQIIRQEKNDARYVSHLEGFSDTLRVRHE